MSWTNQACCRLLQLIGVREESLRIETGGNLCRQQWSWRRWCFSLLIHLHPSPMASSLFQSIPSHGNSHHRVHNHVDSVVFFRLAVSTCIKRLVWSFLLGNSPPRPGILPPPQKTWQRKWPVEFPESFATIFPSRSTCFPKNPSVYFVFLCLITLVLEFYSCS